MSVADRLEPLENILVLLIKDQILEQVSEQQEVLNGIL